MKMTFYCFKDSVTNGYSNPFLQLNRAQAIRTAKWKAKEYANENEGIYTLYKVEEVEIYFTEK